MKIKGVVVVDDEPVFIAVLKIVLEDNGFEVDALGDSCRAKEL
jgi:CheY-like chemotaxis protein